MSLRPLPQVAMGGGLLFLTNFVAITFTAMIVFLALHIDVPEVKEKIEDWHQNDDESLRLRRILRRMPGIRSVRHIDTLPRRLVMILIGLVVLLIPLSRSFNQLKNEYGAPQRENRIRKVATETWQREFGKLPGGEPRSFLGRAEVLADQDGKITLELRILTRQPVTSAEKEQFDRLLETKMGRPKGSVVTQIIEVPTTATAIRLKVLNTQPQAPTSGAQLKTNLFESVDHALAGLYLPPPGQFVNYQIATRPSDGLDLTLIYLSDRDIGTDALALIQQDVRLRLGHPEAKVKLSRLPVSLGRLLFRGKGSTLDRADQEVLDTAAGYLHQYGKLQLKLLGSAGQAAQEDPTTQARISAIKEYLSSHSQITDERIALKQADETTNAWTVVLVLPE